MKLFASPEKRRRSIRAAQYLFAAAGALALGYCLAVFLEARFYQARQRRVFTHELRRKTAARSPAPAAPPDGALLGRLDIPRLGLDVMVVEGVDERDLKRAAGHIPGTALPGEAGNIGIAAHRDTFFRPLRSIGKSDAITLRTLHGTYHYRVVSTNVVAPDDVQVLYPTGRDTLTLVTCFPFYYIGAAPDRFIVTADRIQATGLHGTTPPTLNRGGALMRSIPRASAYKRSTGPGIACLPHESSKQREADSSRSGSWFRAPSATAHRG